jgi:hypothetical protein
LLALQNLVHDDARTMKGSLMRIRLLAIEAAIIN